VIITIDGPAAAGKSTVARALARRLGYRYLDTGAMYRAVALAGLRRGLEWNRPEQLAELAPRLDIELIEDRVFLDGEDVTEAVRSVEVTAVTRHAADNLQVRNHLVSLQRAAAAGGHVVAEGRDQGSVVFPDADCKIFLNASPQERARRRLEDLKAQGEPKPLEDVLDDLTRRDRQDANRPVGPLLRPPGAFELDTDRMTLDEVVDQLESMVSTVRRAREENTSESPDPPERSDG
jgi:cytidylate kinase